MPKTTQDFVTELQTLTESMENAKNQIIAGEELELEGLDDQVDLLCAQIEAAPADIAAATQDSMAKMISTLESLAEILQEKVR